MKGKNWTLFNIKYLQKRTNGRYLIPTRQELFESLKKGNFVQLMFRSTNNKPGFIGIEKMWCEIDGFKDGVYKGSLVNMPQVIDELSFGDRIHFCSEFVLACYQRSRLYEELKSDTARCRLMVSDKIYKQKEAINFLVREMPFGWKDMGWRLLTDLEEMSVYPKGFSNVALQDLDIQPKILTGNVGVIKSVDNDFTPSLPPLIKNVPLGARS